MKICMIGPSFPFRGGVSHYTTLLFRHLKKRHEVIFYSFKRQYPRLLFPGKTDQDTSRVALKEAGTIPCLDSLNPYTWVKVAFRILSQKPQVVIIPWWVIFWAPHFITISALLKIFSKTRIVFLCHNVVEHESGLGKKIISKMVLTFGDGFIVHSAQERDRLTGIIGNGKPIGVAFHPLYDAFNQTVVTRDGALKRLGLGKEKILLFFGFIREYKGLRYLLQALPAILEHIPVRLLIAGEFWDDKQSYLQIIDELDIAEQVSVFDRYIPNEEVPDYFAAADMVVIPYISVTGSGLVQMALAFDRPVVVTDIGVLAEIVKHGETGYVVPPRDPQSIAEAVVTFYNGNREAEMQENIRHDKARFSWDALIDTIEETVGAA